MKNQESKVVQFEKVFIEKLEEKIDEEVEEKVKDEIKDELKEYTEKYYDKMKEDAEKYYDEIKENVFHSTSSHASNVQLPTPIADIPKIPDLNIDVNIYGFSFDIPYGHYLIEIAVKIFICLLNW